MGGATSVRNNPTPTGKGVIVVQIIYGDARAPLLFAENSFDCVVTSPPYFGLRAYGQSSREIGQGNLDDYLIDMRTVAGNLRSWVKPTGTLWLNLGDTASGSGGAGGDFSSSGSKKGIPRYKQGDAGLPKGQWCLVPERVAMVFQEEGWLLRSSITWDKGTTRPESTKHVRRPGVSSERIFMFVLSKEYYFDYHAQELLADRGDVWRFPPARGKRQHMAPYPDELVRRCVSLSTSPGDYVLDPFVGSGTTPRVAERLGRVGVGVDIYNYTDSIEGVDEE